MHEDIDPRKAQAIQKEIDDLQQQLAMLSARVDKLLREEKNPRQSEAANFFDQLSRISAGLKR